MSLAECWHCPRCGLVLPWTQEQEIEEHDCFVLLYETDEFITYEYERIT